MDVVDEKIQNLQRKLRLLRQVFDININNFADLIGVTRQTIYNIENDKTPLTKTQYLAICQIFEVLMEKYPDKRSIIESVWNSDFSLKK